MAAASLAAACGTMDPGTSPADDGPFARSRPSSSPAASSRRIGRLGTVALSRPPARFEPGFASTGAAFFARRFFGARLGFDAAFSAWPPARSAFVFGFFAAGLRRRLRPRRRPRLSALVLAGWSSSVVAVVVIMASRLVVVVIVDVRAGREAVLALDRGFQLLAGHFAVADLGLVEQEIDDLVLDRAARAAARPPSAPAGHTG